MKRVWYTAWPFLAGGAIVASFLLFPLQSLLILFCAGGIVAVTAAIFLRWESYKEPK